MEKVGDRTNDVTMTIEHKGGKVFIKSLMNVLIKDVLNYMSTFVYLFFY